ncbi:50S ribosomal protein L3 [Vreelandella jeotgali]|uniref:50S ribosomal protein L3 n=1 Tax=Vreelandella jeotgali TaxID=553386 RepID=UPI00036C88CF|nr:50S ribosomal protein L3 [Halomonas jeotgali]
MTIGLVGTKSGMTRVFTEDGASVPVTVIQVDPNRVTRVKSVESDGYAAVQVTTGSRKAKHLSRAQAGQFAKAGVEAGRSLMEFRLADGEDAPEVGGELTVSLFEAGQSIDVTGTSKGKGFQGGVKRWNFNTQDMTHGNSLAHRAPGSIGMCQTPGRVFKGKKMAGQMGNARCTVQSLEIVRVDAERNLLLIKGAVPGATGSDVIVRSAVKAG